MNYNIHTPYRHGHEYMPQSSPYMYLPLMPYIYLIPNQQINQTPLNQINHHNGSQINHHNGNQTSSYTFVTPAYNNDQSHWSQPPNGKSVNFPIHQISSTISLPPQAVQELTGLYQTIKVKKYATSALDPVRNCLTAYEYSLNDHWIIWDYETGFIHLTGIWKAAEAANGHHNGKGPGQGHRTKADIVKLLDSTPRQYHQFIKRIRGGFLKIQGTWIPYNLCKILARRFCYNIRYQLIPLFGNDFPNYCITPDDKKFGELKFNDIDMAGSQHFVDNRLQAQTQAQAQMQAYAQTYQTPSRPSYYPPSLPALVLYTSTAQAPEEKPTKYESLAPLKTISPDRLELKKPPDPSVKYETRNYFDIPKLNGSSFELRTPNSVTSSSPTFLRSPLTFLNSSFNSDFNDARSKSLDKYMGSPVSPNYVTDVPQTCEPREVPKESPRAVAREFSESTVTDGPEESDTTSVGSAGGDSSSPTKHSTNGINSLLMAANLTSNSSSPPHKMRRMNIKINDLLS